MDLWHALGMTPQTGLLVAVGGLVTAIVLGAVLRIRADRTAGERGFDLTDHR